MQARMHLNQTLRTALYPFVRLRDRLLLSDHALLRKSQWPVQSATLGPNNSPFFIVGYPRSGTTLLRAILSQHNDVFIPPENGRLGQMIRTYGVYRTRAWEVVVEAVLKEFETGYEFNHWRIELEYLKRAAASLPVEKHTLAELISLVYRQYGCRHAPGRACWGDKTAPGYSSHLWRIALVFPYARYIHLVRDGRDCVASAMKAGFFYKNSIRAAYAWRDAVRECHRFRRKLREQNKFFELRYEDLISTPAKEVSALCHFLDLEPTEAMLHYKGGIDHVSDVRTIPHHQNVARPIFADSIGKWKHQFPPSELYSISRIMQKELVGLGYECT